MSQRLEFLEAAEALADEIWRRRIQTSGGGAAWPNPDIAAQGEPRRQRLGVHLYDGAAGIALFLATLGNVLGSDEHRYRSLQAIAPVRRKLGDLLANPEQAGRLQRLGLGGFRGIGSLIYSFLRIGCMVDEPTLMEEAYRVLDLITPERISQDSIHDVFLGSAGSLLALTTLHRVAPAEDHSGRSLEIASACARSLLLNRSSYKGLSRAWETLPGFPTLTGFSHGAAGICCALLRFFEWAGDPALFEAAQEGLSFERALYSPDHKNWRDMRQPDALHFETSWCYGAPGIILGRLGALSILDDRQVRKEIADGLETTCSIRTTPLDHVCCGNMGRVEVLLYASERLGDESLREPAGDLAREVLRQAKTRGHFMWRFDMQTNFFDPSFFTGASGVGYTLLRLGAPQRLPCVLLLD